MTLIKGISFPFRIGSKGGVVVSESDVLKHTHIEESIQQILLTQIGERVIESFGSQLSSSLFEPNDESAQTLIKYEIVDALKQYEPRIEVSMEDIELSSDDNYISATINYTISDTGLQGTITTQIGG